MGVMTHELATGVFTGNPVAFRHMDVAVVAVALVPMATEFAPKATPYPALYPIATDPSPCPVSPVVPPAL